VKVAAAFLLTVCAVLFAGLAGAEEFKWASSMNEAFETAEKEGREVVVVASEKQTDQWAAKVSLLLEGPENRGLCSSLVGVRVSGAESAQFAQARKLSRLPCVVFLAAKGETHAVFVDSDTRLLLVSVARVISLAVPLGDVPQALDVMGAAADFVGRGELGIALTDQYRAVDFLDKLVAMLRPKKAKNGENSPNPIGERNPKPGGNNGNGDNGSPGSGNSGTTPAANTGTGALDSARWGNLPPKIRGDAADASREEIPAAYRDIVQEYFRKLMKQP